MASTIIWIRPEDKARLIGVTVKVWISELSTWKSVHMSPGEAIEYLRTNWADVTIDWLNDDGQIINGFATVRKMRDGNQVAICWDRTPCIAEAGYNGRYPTNDDLDGWYCSIGSTADPLISADPVKIRSSMPGAIFHYEGRLNQLLNLGGHDKITRSCTVLAGAAREKRYGTTI